MQILTDTYYASAYSFLFVGNDKQYDIQFLGYQSIKWNCSAWSTMTFQHKPWTNWLMLSYRATRAIASGIVSLFENEDIDSKGSNQLTMSTVHIKSRKPTVCRGVRTPNARDLLLVCSNNENYVIRQRHPISRRYSWITYLCAYFSEKYKAFSF